MPDEALTRSVFELPRRRIADLLRSRPDGWWTVDEIAARRRVHRTVAFAHLEALVAAGIATKVAVKGDRGRPANSYRYMGVPVELSYPRQQNRLLAEVLARAAHTGTPPRKVARLLGASAGGLKALGAGYKIDGESIHALTCIFGGVCPKARGVVCNVHAGLIEGAFKRSRVSPRGPDGTGGCLFKATIAGQSAASRPLVGDG